MPLDIDIVFLAGNDQQDALSYATDRSACCDVPVILTRPCVRQDDSRFFPWKTQRLAAFRMPPTPQEPRIEFDTIVECLQATDPAEIERIKARGQFPVHYLKLTIKPGETVRVPLGVKMHFPAEYVALLFPRASSAKLEYRLGNCVGVLDGDYPGEWYAAVRNEGTEPLVLSHGQKFVQVLFTEWVRPKFNRRDSLPDIGSNRTGGFGSTGGHGEDSAGPDYPDGPEEDGFDPGFEGRTSETELQQMILEEAAGLTEAAQQIPQQLEAVSGGPVRDMDSDVWRLELVCNGLRVGPVAKVRPQTHRPMILSDGPGPVVGILQREIVANLGAALPKLVRSLFPLPLESSTHEASPAAGSELPPETDDSRQGSGEPG